MFSKFATRSSHTPDRSHKPFPLICLLIFCAILFLILLIFAITPTNATSYRTKLLEEMETEKNFEDFTNLFFLYEVTSDSITTAYTIKNPEKWNIPVLEPKLTTFSFSAYLSESQNKNNTTKLVQECLSRFSPKNMTKEEQLTHTVLTNYLETSTALNQFPFYEGLLGGSSGVQANLPVTLGEYPLHDKSDVETYLQLLPQISDYFRDIISYEKYRTELGYLTPTFITATSLNSTKTMLEGFQNGDNSFIETFNERIERIDSLSEEEKTGYIETNQKLVNQYVLPAYQDIVTYLEGCLNANSSGNTTNIDTTNLLSMLEETTPYGICTLPKGKEYYKALTAYSTGSSRSIDELITMTDQALDNALGTVLNVALTDQETYYYYCEHPLETYYESPEAILDNLSLMMRKDYPTLSQPPTYAVKTVSESLASSLSPAFYMIPAMDDYKSNTIYINPLFTNEENGNLFPTLAHEGFPGHLYQTVYFCENNPLPIRHLIDYLGYVEGWATYVEIDSLSFLSYPAEKESLRELYQSDIIINLALCSRIDMGVNYEGWTLQDTREYFEENGFNSYYAQDVYSYVVEAPANYLSYFIGYLEIMDIKDAYQRQEMEHYSEKEFHKRFLDVGPADFETVKKDILD